MNTERLEELAALHALDLLEGAELAEFDALIASDPAAAALAIECSQALTGLGLSLPAIEPPTRLRREVMEATRPATVASTSWYREVLPWAMAASFALAALLLWSQGQQSHQHFIAAALELETLKNQITEITSQRDHLVAELQQATGQREEMRVRLEKLESDRRSLQLQVAALQNRDPLDGLRVVRLTAQTDVWKGTDLAAVWDPNRREGRLDLVGLANASPGKDYQLWIISPDASQPISAGVLVTADGHGSQNFQLDQQVKVAALAVSLEPKGGSPSPSGPVILVGAMN